MRLKISKRLFYASIEMMFMLAVGVPIAQQLSGAIYTTDKTGTVVNGNTKYAAAGDVYISGGPQNQKGGASLPNGTYYFQVTDPSGAALLSTDNAICRQLTVANGKVTGAAGPC